MSDLITVEEAGKLLDEVAQNQPRVCLAWCGKSKEDCLCYKAGIAANALNAAAPDLARTVIALHADRDRLQADYEARILSALEPAVQPDADAIKSAAFEIAVLMEIHAATSSTTKAKAEDIERGILALIDKHGKEAALCEMSRLGQEFDAAIFSDVEGLYGEDKTRKEVMPDVRQYQNTAHDTAPAGLSAGGGAGWQPIETAPRDGSRFLGYWPSSGRDGDFAVTTWWDAFDGFWESPFESADYGADYGPTRWMPHPPATEGI